MDGYYNSLLALFDNGVEEGFIKPGARHIVLAAPTAEELLDKMEVLASHPLCVCVFQSFIAYFSFMSSDEFTLKINAMHRWQDQVSICFIC